MKRKLNRFKSAIDNKRGMTLTELLVAMTLLVIASLCFLPLFQSYYGNISTAGKVTQERYESVGLIEKLIGMYNNGIRIGEYDTGATTLPMSMTVDDITIATEQYGLNAIGGSTITSVPESTQSGYNTFIANSVTTKMVCYPQHIADDFLEKDITIYAAGFMFGAESNFSFYVTNSDGSLSKVSQGSTNGTYYKIKINDQNAHLATLTLKGDNGKICFENSPLIIRYSGYNDVPASEELERHDTDFAIEIDAPTVIMVGETGSDGYYFVTSGQTDNDGNLDIIRKKMDSIDQHNGGSVQLNAAMNDVEWVPAGEGDNGAGGSNEYGYYVMCGDNGQIRRFWRNNTTGNYYWGGDYTKEYSTIQGSVVDNTRKYSTNVSTEYYYQKDASDGDGISLNPDNVEMNNAHPDKYTKVGAVNTLYTQSAFSVNALLHYEPYVYVTGNTMYSAFHDSGYADAGESDTVEDKYLVNDTGWLSRFTYNTKYGKDWKDQMGGSGNQLLKNGIFTFGSAVRALNASSMKDYESYTGKSSSVTLTSVDCIKMEQTYASSKYPNQTYTLYCGYIPGVMDIWVTNNSGNSMDNKNDNTSAFSRWRATLGVAFTGNSGPINGSYYAYLGYIYQQTVTSWFTTYAAYLKGNVSNYLRAINNPGNNYAISGLCSASNYSAMTRTNEAVAQARIDSEDNTKNYDNDHEDSVYDPPLNMGFGQYELQGGQNETVISFSYLSDPYAFADASIQGNYYDLSPTRRKYDGVLEWTFDDSLTIMDMDGIHYESYNEKTGEIDDNYFSIAVGYVVAGLMWENQDTKLITVPTVMNNGIVYLRSGGANNEENASGYLLDSESNIFHQFYYTDIYNVNRNIEGLNGTIGGVKNTMMLTCSANYWRDAYHPMFYSTYGNLYEPTDGRDKFSYVMSHILQDKRLTATAWGYTWENAPEAMWGASDGTLMSWYLDTTAAQESSDLKKNFKTGARTVSAEFQSYQELEYANEHYDIYNTTQFEHYYGTVWTTGLFNLPLNWSDMGYNSGKDGALDNADKSGANSSPMIKSTNDLMRTGNKFFTSNNYTLTENSYWDKCSILLENTYPGTIISADAGGSPGGTKALGMISPLKSITDVCYANDIWVVSGVQGLANPYQGKVNSKTVYYCQKGAITSANPGTPSDKGSWVCVRSWYNQSNLSGHADDQGPCEGNNNYLWHVVKVSTKENCNIQQVTYTGGMWYAAGYIDDNKNGEQDAGEHAVVFYATDPTKDCSQDGGWQMSDPGDVGYTQCWINNNGTYGLMDIDGVNAVASRND